MSYFSKLKINDNLNNDIQGTFMNQLKVAENYRLSGGVFNGSSLDTNYYTAVTSNGGTISVANGECTATLTTTANSSAGVYGNSLARYIGANMNYYRTVARWNDTGTTGNTKIGGVCDTLVTGATPVNNGYYFKLSGTTFSVNAIKNGVETSVSSGSLNGDGTQSGLTVTPDVNYHTYEIFYTNKKVMFTIDGTPIHTFTATTSSLTATQHFRPFFYTYNTGVGSAIASSRMAMTINRYGTPISQPKYYFQQGTTAGVLLKTGPGSVHALHVSGIANGSVITLYDNTAASGTVLYSTGTMTISNQSNNLPFDIITDGTGGLQFVNGLYLVISTAASNCLVQYE